MYLFQSLTHAENFSICENKNILKNIKKNVGTKLINNYLNIWWLIKLHIDFQKLLNQVPFL